MAPDGVTTGSVVDDIVAIRDKWHTKHHPMFRDLSEGQLDLRVLGV